MTRFSLILITMIFLAGCSENLSEERMVDFYVAINGSDKNPGFQLQVNRHCGVAPGIEYFSTFDVGYLHVCSFISYSFLNFCRFFLGGGG